MNVDPEHGFDAGEGGVSWIFARSAFAQPSPAMSAVARKPRKRDAGTRASSRSWRLARRPMPSIPPWASLAPSERDEAGAVIGLRGTHGPDAVLPAMLRTRPFGDLTKC